VDSVRKTALSCGWLRVVQPPRKQHRRCRWVKSIPARSLAGARI